MKEKRQKQTLAWPPFFDPYYYGYLVHRGVIPSQPTPPNPFELQGGNHPSQHSFMPPTAPSSLLAPNNPTGFKFGHPIFGQNMPLNPNAGALNPTSLPNLPSLSHLLPLNFANIHSQMSQQNSLGALANLQKSIFNAHSLSNSLVTPHPTVSSNDPTFNPPNSIPNKTHLSESTNETSSKNDQSSKA